MRNPGGRLLKVLEWMWATVQRSRRTRGTCMFQPLQRHRVHQTLKSFWTVVVCLQDQSDCYHQHPHHKSTAYNELPVVNVTTTPSSVNPSSPPADWKMITCSLLSLHMGFKDGGRTYYCWPPQPPSLREKLPELLPSGRRLQSIRVRTSQHQSSFGPCEVELLNMSFIPPARPLVTLQLMNYNNTLLLRLWTH